jgi:hypothetical protein
MDSKQINDFIVKNQDKDYSWLSEKTGVSVDGIRKRYRSLGLSNKKVNAQVIKSVDPEKQFQLDMEKLRLNHEEKGTDKKYKLAMSEIMRLRDDLETMVAVKDAVQTYTINPSKGTGGEAVAIVVASDWHVEENVKPETVNNTNDYTMAIAKRRSEKFFQHTLQLIEKEQHAVKIETLVLALIGDFFSGNIHDELMETCEVAPQDAMLFAQNLIASGIEFLLANSKLNILIPCCVGNHSRMTKKVHVSTEHGNSLEWAMYNFLAKYFSKEKRVTFVLSRSYHNYIDIFGYVIRFHHGHAIQSGGGVGGLTIPVLKAIAKWDNDTKAYLDVFGHFHQLMHNAKFVINGSLIGDSPYGKRLGFTGRPEQAFFLIDKKRGKTVSCPILVQ